MVTASVIRNGLLIAAGALALAGCQLRIPDSASYTLRCSSVPLGDPGSATFFVMSNRLPDCREGGLRFSAYRNTSLTYFQVGRAGGPVNRRYEGAGQAEWIKDLKAQAREGRVLVYVHGYLNDFGDELERAARLGEFQGPGVPVVIFDWASINRTFGYTVDENSALWAQEHFDGLLAALADAGLKVTVVAHSMGNRIVIGALRNPTIRLDAGRAGRIDRVVMASADVDRALAHAALADIARPGRQIVAYVSRKDRAIWASIRTHGYAVLGSPACERDMDYRRSVRRSRDCHRIKSLAGVAVVDTSEVASSRFAGHRDFVESCPVAEDLKRFLAGLEPADRLISAPSSPPDGGASDDAGIGYFLPRSAHAAVCDGAKHRRVRAGG